MRAYFANDGLPCGIFYLCMQHCAAGQRTTAWHSQPQTTTRTQQQQEKNNEKTRRARLERRKVLKSKKISILRIVDTVDGALLLADFFYFGYTLI